MQQVRVLKQLLRQFECCRRVLARSTHQSASTSARFPVLFDKLWAMFEEKGLGPKMKESDAAKALYQRMTADVTDGCSSSNGTDAIPSTFGVGDSKTVDNSETNKNDSTSNPNKHHDKVVYDEEFVKIIEDLLALMDIELR